ncbi:MAG: right-handed parallel beta-helix repeat-containing protein, partial [Terrimicrobiaceae bacterium]
MGVSPVCGTFVWLRGSISQRARRPFPLWFALFDAPSHLRVQGLLIQRFAGGAGGISVTRNEPGSNHITISNNEIRFVSGHAGAGLNFCDNVTVENCYIHHCPAWTTAVFISRVNDFVVRNCRLDKNSGSGVRHYEAKRGKIHDNVILNHYGMHSSTINVYEGCEDITIERNHMHNVIAINRNAENLVIRQNVVDSQCRF